MYKFLLSLLAVIMMLALLLGAFGGAVHAAPADKACWGQATKIFAQTGEMGKHASNEPTPRLGLRNLARALFLAGVIPDDSMQALGVFVTTVLGPEYTPEACMK